jgi:hypothetical protein
VETRSQLEPRRPEKKRIGKKANLKVKREFKLFKMSNVASLH